VPIEVRSRRASSESEAHSSLDTSLDDIYCFKIDMSAGICV